jgi:hypothetical protein
MTSDDNYSVFRECLSSAIVARSEKPRTNKRRPKAKRNTGKEVTSEADSGLPERVDPEELAEFVDVRIPSLELRAGSVPRWVQMKLQS